MWVVVCIFGGCIPSPTQPRFHEEGCIWMRSAPQAMSPLVLFRFLVVSFHSMFEGRGFWLNGMVIFVFAFCPICVDSSGLRNHFIPQKIHRLQNMNSGLHWREKSWISNWPRYVAVNGQICRANPQCIFTGAFLIFAISRSANYISQPDIYALGAQGTWVSLRVYGRSPALSIFQYLSLWPRRFLPTEHRYLVFLAVRLTARPPRVLALCHYSTLQPPPSCVAVLSSNWLISIHRLSTGFSGVHQAAYVEMKLQLQAQQRSHRQQLLSTQPSR